MSISRLLVVMLCGYVLLPCQSSASIIYGATNTPDITSPCSPTCPELTTGVGRGAFDLVSPATIDGITFWTFESQGVYHGGSLNWRIFTSISNAPGTLLGSGNFALLPRNFLQGVSVFGLALDWYENDLALAAPLTITPSSSPQHYFLELQDSSGTDQFGIFQATNSPSSLAFQLLGSGNAPLAPTVPEPAGFLLAGSALLSLAAWRRTKHFECKRRTKPS